MTRMTSSSKINVLTGTMTNNIISDNVYSNLTSFFLS